MLVKAYCSSVQFLMFVCWSVFCRFIIIKSALRAYFHFGLLGSWVNRMSWLCCCITSFLKFFAIFCVQLYFYTYLELFATFSHVGLFVTHLWKICKPFSNSYLLNATLFLSSHDSLVIHFLSCLSMSLKGSAHGDGRMRGAAKYEAFSNIVHSVHSRSAVLTNVQTCLLHKEASHYVQKRKFKSFHSLRSWFVSFALQVQKSSILCSRRKLRKT